jgi:hypothetical protein
MTNQSKAKASAPQHGAHRGSKVVKKGMTVPGIVNEIQQDATRSDHMEMNSCQIAKIDMNL